MKGQFGKKLFMVVKFQQQFINIYIIIFSNLSGIIILCYYYITIKIKKKKNMIRSFIENNSYKLILPIFLIANWVWMVVGPLYFQQKYQQFYFCLIAFMIIKAQILLICAIVAFVKGQKVFEKMQQNKITAFVNSSISDKKQQALLHAYIIPNYNEDIELLKETVTKIQIHPWAKQRAMIFFAMEANQKQAASKAETLCAYFKNSFKLVGYTLHILQPCEQRGKASNVNWCVQHLENLYFKHNNISTDSVMLTIIDADSWVPAIYVTELQEHLLKEENFKRKDQFIYQPNQIFGRNHLEIPIFNRCFDEFFSSTHNAHYLNSIFDIGFAMSNYSLSFNLIQKIGFWDKDPDSITQDLHTTMKAFWKMQGEIYTVPIFTPFNQLNLMTGRGYCADLKAKFWQVERHFEEVADIAYNIKMFLNNPFNFRSFIMSYNAIQPFILPSIVPWAIMGMAFLTQILLPLKIVEPSPEFAKIQNANFIILGLNLMFFIVHIMYQYTKRTAMRLIYGLQYSSTMRILEFPLVYFANIIIFVTPCLVIASFKILSNNRQYIVAEKKQNK